MFIQFRNVNGKNVVCMIYREKGQTDKTDPVVEPLKSREHLIETLVNIGHDGRNVALSSTIDFPEDETDDPDQIELAQSLWS